MSRGSYGPFWSVWHPLGPFGTRFWGHVGVHFDEFVSFHVFDGSCEGPEGPVTIFDDLRMDRGGFF